MNTYLNSYPPKFPIPCYPLTPSSASFHPHLHRHSHQHLLTHTNTQAHACTHTCKLPHTQAHARTHANFRTHLPPIHEPNSCLGHPPHTPYHSLKKPWGPYLLIHLAPTSPHITNTHTTHQHSCTHKHMRTHNPLLHIPKNEFSSAQTNTHLHRHRCACSCL